MATTDRPATGNATALADALREADLCHLLVRAEGDALAAAAVLAGACQSIDTPYHASAVRTRGDLDARLSTVDESAEPVVLGASVPNAISVEGDGPTSLVAYETARALGTEPDPVTALAGAVTAGEIPGDDETSAYEDAVLERRPGVATPTDDPVDGLAYATLAHSEYAGDPGACRAAIDVLELDDESSERARRKIASLLAIAVASDPDLSDRGATAVERALRPHRIEGSLATLEGYADVLSVLAVEAPGLGLALGLGDLVSTVALERWREHATAAHDAVRGAETARHDGLVVATVDGPVETAARLLRDYRSPEPVVLAVDRNTETAAVAGDSAVVGDSFATAVEATGGDALGAGTTGFARDVNSDDLVDAVRREL